MELKRFILTNAYGHNEIVDIEKRWDKMSRIARITFRTKECECLFSYREESILKTSDNILDLVENMDLIGCKVNNPFINNQVIYMVIDNPLFLSDLVFFLVNGDKVWFRDSQYDDEEKYADIKRNGIEIISIYKRQPNGDYKRYEVK